MEQQVVRKHSPFCAFYSAKSGFGCTLRETFSGKDVNGWIRFFSIMSPENLLPILFTYLSSLSLIDGEENSEREKKAWVIFLRKYYKQKKLEPSLGADLTYYECLIALTETVHEMVFAKKQSVAA